MCKLFPCIPVFKGLFSIKSVKKMYLCDSIKNRIVTCEKCIY